MKREDVMELHYIAPLENLASILDIGILSHYKAKFIPHVSIALPSVQAHRARKPVPGGTNLHQYVNLYFNAFNPMLSKRRDDRERIAVLAIHPEVLDLPGVFITDGNAASEATVFSSPDEQGLSLLSYRELHSTYWTSKFRNEEEQEEDGRRRCAEVLVPDHIHRSFINRLYCANEGVKARIITLGCTLEIVEDAEMFFTPKEKP